MKLYELTDASVTVEFRIVMAPKIIPETKFESLGVACSREEALRLLENLPKSKNYAIAYFENDRDKERIDYFEKVVRELRMLKKAYKNIAFSKVIDDETVSCPSCGSVLNKKFLKTNYCPLCGKNLVPQSWKDEFSKIDITIQNYENEIRKLKEGTRMWLLRTKEG